MKIAIIGASGFVGKKLIKKLLDETDYTVIAISLHPKKINIENKNLTILKCDIFDTAKLENILMDSDLAYYLVHMMAKDYHNFPTLEDEAAKSFCVAANRANLKKVIYLGGLGDDQTELSKHLKSRHKTGNILGERIPTVYEFRASILIGSGSSSFEIIKSIVNKTSFMILPKWANTQIQPICASDTLEYLFSAVNLDLSGHHIFEIGGPKTMTYKELLTSYASFKNKTLKILIINWLPRWPAKYWLRLFIDKKLFSVTAAMLESLDNEVVVKKSKAKEYFSNILPNNIESEYS